MSLKRKIWFWFWNHIIPKNIKDLGRISRQTNIALKKIRLENALLKIELKKELLKL